MNVTSKRLALVSGAALVALSVGVDQAAAGAFAIREQSAAGQGTSFAGVAAGGALSSMFWNPATMTQFSGFNSETDASVILGYAANNPTAGTYLALGGTGNVIDPAVVPSSYLSYQLSRDIWVGLSINSPFGLAVDFPDSWAGRVYGDTASIRSYNFTPSVAWQATNWLSIGAGFQVQYAKASLTSGIPGLTGTFTNLGGSGWAYGATVGVNIKAGPQTDIGVGWRSALNQKIDGGLSVNGSPFGLVGGTFGSASTTINLPDIVSLGIRHRIDPMWTVMATAEFTNWHRIGTSVVTTPGGPATVTVAGVTAPVAIAFQYRNGWFFSGGAEYKWTPQTTLRAGIGYEISPITDQVRIPTLPDNNRLWLSAGVSYKAYKWLTFDLAYSHAFMPSTHIDVSAASGNPSFNGATTYIGDVRPSFDIISLAARIALSPEPEPARLITK